MMTDLSPLSSLSSGSQPLQRSVQCLARTQQFYVEQVEITFGNAEVRLYERLVAQGHGAVLVVPVLDAEHFLLIREWCSGTERYELGFPKGKIDAGETPEQAGIRECIEEVGYRPASVSQLYQQPLTLSPAYMSNQIHVLLAQDLTPATADGDEPEPLEVVVWRWDALDALLLRDDFSEARSIAALWLAQRYLGKS